jgi:hypothetical protein
VTEAIHKAHADAEVRRAKLTRRPKKGLVIAAAAGQLSPKPSSKTMKKSSAPKRRKK